MKNLLNVSRPLKLAICSWCSGIGGGAARMETYYYQHYDRALFDPYMISLIERPPAEQTYDDSIPFIQVDQKNRFFHLLEILKDFDVIQFQGSFNPVVCEVSRYLQKPHILLEVLHNIEEGRLFDSVDGTIGVSSAVAKIQGHITSYRTILNGIKLAEFPCSKEKKSDDKIILLQVSRRDKVAINLDEIADLLLLIDPRIELWIAGAGQTLQSTDRVKFLGVKENIYELYKKAHFLVLLSKEEPFGLVAIESMAAGTPVILSKSGGFLDIIRENSQGYLVEGPTREEAVKVIRDAVSKVNTASYEAMSLAGRKLVEENFSIESCVHKYEEFILELYQNKLANKVARPQPLRVPQHALVGEALYDFQAGNNMALCQRLKDLSSSLSPIREIITLKTAHQLGQYLKFKMPDKLPEGFFVYLFFSGDRTEYTCNEILNDLEYLKKRGLYDEVLRYFEETKLEFPDRWNRAINS